MPEPPSVQGGARDVYIEFVALGGQVKVSAIDSTTDTEVSIFGPVNTPRSMLTKTVLAKLDYVLKKKAGAGVAE